MGNWLIFQYYKGRRGNTRRSYDILGYVEQRQLSVGSRPVESHCEEKQAKSEGAILLIPGVHEK